MFDQTILERMPYPFGYLYNEMLHEDDPHLKFRGVIKVFVGGVKYLSLLYIADYMQNADSDMVNTLLSESLSRPSAGKWLHFIRTINKHYKSSRREFQVKELAHLKGRTNVSFDRMVKLRNKWVHPDRFPTQEDSQRLIDENLPVVHSILESLSFLARYRLVRLDVQNGEEHSLMGNDIALNCSGNYTCLVRTAAGAELDITPFILITVDEALGQLFVYESLVGSLAEYGLYNEFRLVDEKDDRVRLLREVIWRCRSAEKERRARERDAEQRVLQDNLDRNTVQIVNVKRRAHDHSERVFNEFKDAGRYDPQTYVRRKNIQKAYQSLFDGTRNGLVIVADSGAGKSTEICCLYTEEDLRDDLVWILSGRRYPASSPLSEIGQDLFDGAERYEEQLERLLRALDRKRTTQRFVVLFDGLNETDSPVDAFRHLNDFIDTNGYDWVKVIITCRSFVWKAIEDSGVIPAKNRYVLTPNGSVAHVLQPFDDEELAQALEKYSSVYKTSFPSRWNNPQEHDYRERRILKSPLILRFVFEAFKERGIPTPLDVETIMKEFTKQRLRDQDFPFLAEYLMAYFYREESDILDTWTLRDSQTERSDMNPVERKAYKKLAEHIWGEQVDTLDELWTCQSRTCPNFGRSLFLEDEANQRCPRCFSEIVRDTEDNRSTYSRLLTENILSETESSGHVFVRLVFDRYFDYLMRRFCLVEKMNNHYDAQIIDDLFQKSKRSAIFIEPLQGLILDLWTKGEPAALYQIAAKDDYTAYQILREVFAEFVEVDFSGFTNALHAAVQFTDFNTNICRSGVHALLADPQTAKTRRSEIVDLLVLLSQCPSDMPHDEAAEYLVELRGRGVDLISELARRCSDIILEQLRLTRVAWIFVGAKVSAKRRRRVRGLLLLYFNTVICGLGNFFDDEVIRTTVFEGGLAILHRVLLNPLLSLTQRRLVRVISKKFANMYKEKGPLPCNYWEMLFQLRQNPEAIRRAGELFFVEKQNLFDLDYVEFRAQVHSENGLISWYILSLLPSHYAGAQNVERAIEYMRRFASEGTEMDRYVIGQTAVLVLSRPEGGNQEIEQLLSDIGRMILKQPHQIFLHPEPVIGLGDAPPRRRFARFIEFFRKGTRQVTAEEVVKYNRERIAQIRASTDPYSVPWITMENDVLDRFYLNTVVFHVARLYIEREKPARFEFLLDIIERNREEDFLRFGSDERAGRQFVIYSLIQALGIAARQDGSRSGFIDETLGTIDTIIRRYVLERHDPENGEVYQRSLCDTLKSIKNSHRNRVLGFLERYDLNRPELRFLDEVRKAPGEQRKLFNMSLYGDNIYERGLATKMGREVFGAATMHAAGARDVDEFFDIYATHFVNWVKTLTL